MNCNRIQTLISAYLDEELNAEEKREFRKHLITCKECNEEYQSLLGLKTQLENVIPEPFQYNVMADLRMRLAGEEHSLIPPAHNLLWFKRLSLVATCAAAFILTSLMLFPLSQGVNLAQKNSTNNLELEARSLMSSDGNSYAPAEPVSSYDQNLSLDQSVNIYQASLILP